MIRSHLRQSGFTLIEMLIYMVIVVIVATASVGFLISLNTFVTQYRVETALYRSGTNVLEHVGVALRQAESFDALNSVIENPSAGVLAVDSGATTTEFVLAGGELQLHINGENFGDLTSDSVTVNKFTVYRHPTAVGDLVRVRIDMTATIPDVTKSQTLYSSSVIRGDI